MTGMIVSPDPGVKYSLAVLGETGLVTTEQAKAISTAVASYQAMKQVSSGIEERHFGKIDTALSILAPSATSKAREELATIGRVWKEFSGDFHRFRELFFQTKVMKAKLAKAKKSLESQQSEEDTEILKAEIELDQARIDKIEAEVAAGHAALQQTLSTVSGASERYSALCISAGKEPTVDDFRNEEAEYLIKSAFWHASQVFGIVELRVNPRADSVARLRIGKEVLMLFVELGISQDEVRQELTQMNDQVRTLDMISEGCYIEPEKEARFLQWLSRMGAKYKQRTVSCLQAGGHDRMKRIAGMIKPADQDDVGKRPGVRVDRSNFSE